MQEINKRILSIEDLQPGDHVCCIFDTDEQHGSLLFPYLLTGISENDKFVYIADKHAVDSFLVCLKEQHPDSVPRLESGQVSALTPEESYMKHGSFHPGEMLEFLGSEAQKAIERGYRALRVAIEMTWALEDVPGSERLIEFESQLNEFMRDRACIALGLYDSRLFHPRVLINILSTHPIAVIGTEMFENFYYIPPDKFLSGNRSAVVYDQWISALKSYDRALRELEKSEKTLMEMFESSLEGITITGPDGLYLFVNQAAAKMLGYGAPEQMIGKSTLYHYGDPELRAALFEELEKEGFLRNYETLAKKLDGSVFPVQLSCTFKKNSDGDLESITTFFRDLTETKIKEEIKMIRELSSHVLAERERERKGVARDIHDQFGQTLSCIKIDLNWIHNNLPDGNPEILGKLSYLRDQVDEVIGQVRDLASRLHPVVLDRLGLGPALESLLEDVTNHFDIEYSIEGDLEGIDMDKEAEVTAFRIVQESLTNVARHSGASMVRLVIDHDKGVWVLKVIDNGSGLSADDLSNSLAMGIRGMRERARGAGWDLSLEGAEGEGTAVTLRIPSEQKKLED